MLKNKNIQLRISEELYQQVQHVSDNISQFIRTAIREKLAKLPKKQKKGSKAELRTRSPYIYYAELVDVIDGDTLRVKIDMGFFATIQEKIRLATINTQPLNTPKGKAAAEYVKHELTGANLIIETRKKEKFGRYLAYVHYSKEHTKFEDIIREGKLLNDELVNHGHAKRYKS